MKSNKSKFSIECIDARKALRKLKEQSVDLIVSDIAYKTISGGNKTINAPKGMLSENDGKGGFKHNSIHISEYADQLFRVLKDPAHCYLFSNLKNLFSIRDEMLRVGFQLHNILIWKKNTANPNRWYMQDKEFILFFRKGKAFPVNDMGIKSVIELDNIVGNRKHPSEKPVKLTDILIKQSSKPGDLVLDFMMGSGSTGISSLKLRRKFLGFDIDSDHYYTANYRLKLFEELNKRKKR